MYKKMWTGMEIVLTIFVYLLRTRNFKEDLLCCCGGMSLVKGIWIIGKAFLPYWKLNVCLCFQALYIDAAIYIPAELPQVQDLIIEKELRIHVTPEELEILRT